MTVESLHSLVPNESKSLHIKPLLCKKFIHQGHYISLQILPNRSVWGDLESIFGVEMTFLCTPKSCIFGSEEKKNHTDERMSSRTQIYASEVANYWCPLKIFGDFRDFYFLGQPIYWTHK